MKYYIILTPGIADMGGSQMYTRNKMKYMKAQGYNVNIFHASMGNDKIVINDLLEYKNNRDFHLNYPAYSFNKQIQKIVISFICDKLPPQLKELIIESHSTATATWGELLAERLNAKHIVFLLSEYNSLRNDIIYKFFKFKLERRELIGITKKIIPMLFRGWEKIEEDISYHLKASCTNVVENVDYPLLTQIPRSDFTIASICRLNKLFLIDILEDLTTFIKIHSNNSFTIILIGGEPKGSNSKRKIEQIFKKIVNVNLFFTGYIYPIPKELVLLPDVFISSAGAGIVSSTFGKITISIDSNDHKPIGIVGRTTNNFTFRDDEPKVSLQELLNDILIKKVYKSAIINSVNTPQVDFSEHLGFILASDGSKSYFNINSVRLSLKDWIEKISLLLLGDNLLRTLSLKLLPFWNKLRK